MASHGHVGRFSSATLPAATRAAVTFTAATAALCLAAQLTPARAAVTTTVDGSATVLLGTNKSAYTRSGLTGGTWRSLGGQFKSNPVVTFDGSTHHYIGVGTNDHLYHRTDSTGWAALTPAMNCTDLAAAASPDLSTIALACHGRDNRVYAGTFPATSAPSTTLKNLGGITYGAPAVVYSQGNAQLGIPAGPVVFARGGSYSTGDPLNPTSSGYQRTLTSTGWSKANKILGNCSAAPSVLVYGSSVYSACQTGSTMSTFSNRMWDGEDPWRSYSAGTSGTPTISLGKEGPTIQVIGGGGAPYYLTMPSERWTKTGGTGTANGIASTGLSFPAQVSLPGTFTRVAGATDTDGFPGAISDDGTRLFATVHPLDELMGVSTRYLTEFTSTGRQNTVLTDYAGTMSADGKIVLVGTKILNRSNNTTTTLDPGASNVLMARDGSAVAFDVNGTLKVWQRSTGTIVTVPTAQGVGSPTAISANGRYIAMPTSVIDRVTGTSRPVSAQPFAVSNDGNRVLQSPNSDLLLQDLAAGTTQQISSTLEGSSSAQLSSDGARVTFTKAWNDDNIYQWFNGITSTIGTGAQFQVSADGLTIAAQDGYSNLKRTVKIYNAATGTSSEYSGFNGNTDVAALSANGRYVLLQTAASNIVPGDTNGVVELLVWDRLG